MTDYYAGNTYMIIGKFTLPDTGESVEITEGSLNIKDSKGDIDTLDFGSNEKVIIDDIIQYQLNYTFPEDSEFLTFIWKGTYNNHPISEFRIVDDIKSP